jgi:hypothetical protein
MGIEHKHERQTDNMGAAGRVETGPPKIEQDYDLNGKRSNSESRETARIALATNKDLTPEQKRHWENQTSCLRGEALRKASAADTKVSPASDVGKGGKSDAMTNMKDASFSHNGIGNDVPAGRAKEAERSDVMTAFGNAPMLDGRPNNSSTREPSRETPAVDKNADRTRHVENQTSSLQGEVVRKGSGEATTVPDNARMREKKGA